MSDREKNRKFKETIKQPSLMASVNLKKLEQQAEQYVQANETNILAQCKYNKDADIER